MYNYNRDVVNAEHERWDRMTTAADRQVPHHLRAENWKRTKGWLSQNILAPAGATLSTILNAVSFHGGRYWRRSSSRAKGLLFNGLEAIVPGRA